MVTVDWSHVLASASPAAYGLNAFQGFDPAVTGSPAYQRTLRLMAPGLLRLHNGGSMSDSATTAGWIDTRHQNWDRAKIKAALAGFPPGAALLVNIPGWPDWMDRNKDGFLDADQTEAYARLCADLVRVVGRDCGRGGLYWEVTNEQDGRYFVDRHTAGGWGALKDPAQPDRVEELAGIYVRCAAAMKAADPSIHVGGPALARADLTPFVRRFVRAAGAHLDFFSFHAYASGSASDTDAIVFDRAQGFGGVTQSVAEAVQAEAGGRAIPLFLDEYNISWTWETRDPRMTDIKGAVFDALAATAALAHGAAATLAWNECDGIYGKMDNDYRPRPAATLFHWLNADMVGTLVSAVSAEPGSVGACAVQTKSGRKSLLLINRSPLARRVVLRGWSAGQATQRQLSAEGETRKNTAGRDFVLPAVSVTLFTAR